MLQDCIHIPHNAGLNQALSNMLQAKQHKAVSTDDLVKMAHFVLENNYLEFSDDVKNKFQEKQLVQVYMCLSMDDLETKFLQF